MFLSKNQVPSNPAASKSTVPGAPAQNEPLRAAAKILEKREAICNLVKDALRLCGVPTGSYRFKVLCLDQDGNIFAVLVDIKTPLPQGVEQQLEAETLVVKLAASRYTVTVSAIYWRTSSVPSTSISAQNADSIPGIEVIEYSALSDTNYGDIV